jgi:hypothetical protein
MAQRSADVSVVSVLNRCSEAKRNMGLTKRLMTLDLSYHAILFAQEGISD